MSRHSSQHASASTFVRESSRSRPAVVENAHERGRSNAQARLVGGNSTDPRTIHHSYDQARIQLVTLINSSRSHSSSRVPQFIRPTVQDEYASLTNERRTVSDASTKKFPTISSLFKRTKGNRGGNDKPHVHFGKVEYIPTTRPRSPQRSPRTNIANAIESHTSGVRGSPGHAATQSTPSSSSQVWNTNNAFSMKQALPTCPAQARIVASSQSATMHAEDVRQMRMIAASNNAQALHASPRVPYVSQPSSSPWSNRATIATSNPGTGTSASKAAWSNHATAGSTHPRPTSYIRRNAVSDQGRRGQSAGEYAAFHKVVRHRRSGELRRDAAEHARSTHDYGH